MRVATVIVLGLLAGCTGDDDGGGDGACAKVWYADAIYEGASAEIAGGQLVLRAPRAEGRAAIEVARPIPDGNFDVSFDISGFTAGGASAFVGAVVQHASGAGDETLTGALLTAGVAAYARPSGASDQQPSTATVATVRLVRSGPEVTVTTSAADATATITSTYDFGGLVLALQLGSTGDFVGAESTATIEAMEVAAGAFDGDAFACNSFVGSFD
jgi:hypothetical protein